jgi:hypothetical protein
MENVTPHNQAKAADDQMPNPAESNQANDVSLTTLTETPAPTEIPAQLKTPNAETLANENAPSRTGWIAYIFWIATAPAWWAFKQIKTLLTFGTLWKAYIAYQVFTTASGIFFPSGNGSSTRGDASIHQPPVVQHFMFEPVGYSYASSSPQFPLNIAMLPQSFGTGMFTDTTRRMPKLFVRPSEPHPYTQIYPRSPLVPLMPPVP